MSLILVIDDEFENRELVALWLESRGHVVVTASQGERALALLDAMAPAHPDIIITDMMMPVLDGIGFLRAYAVRPPPVAAIVAISAFAPYLVEALTLGADAVLSKPLGGAELQAVVADLEAGRAIPPSPPLEGSGTEVERRRLQELVRLSLEGPPQEALEPVVERVARMFDVQTCLVSIVTQARQFWTAGCDMPVRYAEARGGPREQSFCAHAVSARAALVVQDALANPLFVHNPFVTDEGIRFYAGVPLVSELGHVLGTLCLVDTRQRLFGHFDLELLSILARRVALALEDRHDEYVDHELDIPGRACLVDLADVEAWRSAAMGQACALVAVESARPLAQAKVVLEERFDRAWIGRLGSSRLGLVAPGVSESAARDIALEATADARCTSGGHRPHPLRRGGARCLQRGGGCARRGVAVARRLSGTCCGPTARPSARTPG